MYFATVLLCHVLGAIGVGPIFTLPLLAKTPTALHAVLVLLRFGAGVTLVSGILLWVVLKPGHPLWLDVSSALFFAVIVLIGGFLVVAWASTTLSQRATAFYRVAPTSR